MSPAERNARWRRGRGSGGGEGCGQSCEVHSSLPEASQPESKLRPWFQRHVSQQASSGRGVRGSTMAGACSVMHLPAEAMPTDTIIIATGTQRTIACALARRWRSIPAGLQLGVVWCGGWGGCLSGSGEHDSGGHVLHAWVRYRDAGTVHGRAAGNGSGGQAPLQQCGEVGAIGGAVKCVCRGGGGLDGAAVGIRRGIFAVARRTTPTTYRIYTS